MASSSRAQPQAQAQASLPRRLARWVLRRTVWLSAIAAALVGVALLIPASWAATLAYPIFGLLTGAPSLPDDLGVPAERSVVYDAAGDELGVFHADQNRRRVTFGDIDPLLIQTVLTVEDREFEEHAGLSQRGVLRAVAANLVARETTQGGSTITQQYVKLTQLSAERTWDRKVHEAWFAIQLERRLSKREILERYLNEVYLGDGVYGVGAAMEHYFDGDVGDVAPEEAALLAGMLRAPSQLSPTANPDRALERRNTVLSQMVDTGVLTPTEAERATAEDLPEPSSAVGGEIDDPLLDVVFHRLAGLEALGEDRDARAERVLTGGLEIHTTIDPEIQLAAADAVAIDRTPGDDPLVGTVAVEPGSGAVRAIVTSPDCDDAQEPCDVNPLVAGMGGSGRQTGSAYKPFVAAAALDADVPVGWQEAADSGTPIEGCEVDDGLWEPGNYGGASPGEIALAEATTVSNNTYFAQLAARLGSNRVAETARALGLPEAAAPADCTAALGTGSAFAWDVAGAYAALVDGTHCGPYLIDRVVDGVDELIGEDNPSSSCRDAFDPAVADGVTGLLTDVVASGTGTAADPGFPAAGKTGTTSDHRDAWFAGHTGTLAAAVWVGFADNRPMEGVLGQGQVTGGSVPARVWAQLMREAAEPASDPLPSAPSATNVAVADLDGWEVGEVFRAYGDPGPPFDGTMELHVRVEEVAAWQEAGTVVGQSTDPGEALPAGSFLTVEVSDGDGDPPEVPDVVGLSEEDAVDELLDADYEPSVSTETTVLQPGDSAYDDFYDGFWDEGVTDEQRRQWQGPRDGHEEVIAQSPDPDTPLEPGEEVEIVVRLIEPGDPPPPPLPGPPDDEAEEDSPGEDDEGSVDEARDAEPAREQEEESDSP